MCRTDRVGSVATAAFIASFVMPMVSGGKLAFEKSFIESVLVTWRLPTLATKLSSPSSQQRGAAFPILLGAKLFRPISANFRQSFCEPLLRSGFGPRIYSYEKFLQAVAHQAGLKPILVPIPFAAWHALTWISEMFPNPPLTRNQVELMQIDTVSSPEMPGFDDLGISPHPVEEILQKMLADFRGGLA
jgi:hypothetical protein